MSSIQTASSNPGPPKDLTSQQLRYQKRKLAGLCCYGTCSGKTTDGHTFCHRHLRQMAHQVSGIYKRRTDQKLCRECGTRPQFWGVRCLICRQLVTNDPLPRGARTALRKYREQETQCLREKARETVRTAARELVAKGSLKGREEEALRLYLGLEDNGWRTYKQVAQLMHLSVERVRQLLLPSKTALALSLSERVPWRSRTRTRKQHLPSDSWSIQETTSRCEHSKMKILRGQSVVYTAAGLPHVILQGLPVSQCTKCKVEQCHIPRQEELHNLLARTLLSKSNVLSGQEIRFSRRVAHMNAAEFAERLDVTRQTLQAWEARPALRYANDIAARSILASLIPGANLSSQTLKLPNTTPHRHPEHSVITAEWVATSGCWKLESD